MADCPLVRDRDVATLVHTSSERVRAASAFHEGGLLDEARMWLPRAAALAPTAPQVIALEVRLDSR